MDTKKKRYLGFFNTCLLFGFSSLTPLLDTDVHSKFTTNSLLAENQKNTIHISEVEDGLFQQRLNDISKRIPLDYNPVVKKQILRYFYVQEQTEILLGRAINLQPLFLDIVNRYGLPPAIANLPIIESGVVCDAKSHAGAVGYWQFMKGTGDMYDLKVNKHLDERKDPEKSTHAAAQYLRDLHNEFDDWLLALAAYNCGPGNVRKAIRRSGGKKDYWEIRNYLPKETRYYIPKFIAANYVMHYYFMHNLTPKLPYKNWMYDYLLTVDQDWTVAKFASDFKISESEFRRLNPAILGTVIPAKDNPMTLRMPFPPGSEEPPRLMTIAETVNEMENVRLEEPRNIELLEPRTIEFVEGEEMVLEFK